ncbi:MAG: response regulator transcription factor [Prosthecobacter sp.]|nr:response regulator transcription factor [Prosthecobacter sp.]
MIEDALDLGSAMVRELEEEGHKVAWETNGDDGLFRALEWDHDLIILDRMLPEMDGMEVLRRLRAKKRVPVLMLTALNTLRDRLHGLDGGADDYLGKPFELPELLARIRALLRRSSEWSDECLVHGDLRLDMESKQAFKAGAEVVLTASEFATVELLLSRRGRPVSKQILEERLHEDAERFHSNSLEVHIHRIRSKLGHDFIQTKRGFGYFVPKTGGGT